MALRNGAAAQSAPGLGVMALRARKVELADALRIQALAPLPGSVQARVGRRRNGSAARLQRDEGFQRQKRITLS